MEKNMGFVPNVIKKNERGEQMQDIFSHLLSDRIIFLGEEINDLVSNLVVAQMLYLEAQNPDKDIQLYINSPGGAISAGLAIYDTMHYVKCDVSTICVGQAASIAALLLSGGTQGKRLALENVEIMIHQPIIGGSGVQGQATDIKIVSDHLQSMKNRIFQILSENTGHSVEEIEKDCERDHFMTAEDAKNYGIIDAIIVNR